jgi:8-oxo-dGTP pyrophosphatase MutT (NUDIX family)
MSAPEPGNVNRRELIGRPRKVWASTTSGGFRGRIEGGLFLLALARSAALRFTRPALWQAPEVGRPGGGATPGESAMTQRDAGAHCGQPAPEGGQRGRLADRLWRIGLCCAYGVQLAVRSVLQPNIRDAYVAVWHAGRVLVIRNSYRREFSLPAGMLERRERPAEAAARELAEEVGILVPGDALRYAGQIIDASRPGVEHAHIFELHCADEPALRVDGREVIWAGFLPPEQALERGLASVVRRYLDRTAEP